jgi:ribosomal protein S18 acetylase RimI-like enzyme
MLTLPMLRPAAADAPSPSTIPGVCPGSLPAVGAGQPFHLGAMTPSPVIRQAEADDIPAIIGLINDAATWLQRYKNTNQWAEPWPDEQTRNGRIIRGVDRGATWMVECGGALAGTLTYRNRANPRLWTQEELNERAVYVSRLIVDRDYAGRGLGAALIDWAGMRGIQRWQADWIRVDVWTTNVGLHNYYKGQDFEYLRTIEVEHEWDYPSAVLFQRSTALVNMAAAGQFEVMEKAAQRPGISIPARSRHDA